VKKEQKKTLAGPKAGVEVGATKGSKKYGGGPRRPVVTADKFGYPKLRPTARGVMDIAIRVNELTGSDGVAASVFDPKNDEIPTEYIVKGSKVAMRFHPRLSGKHAAEVYQHNIKLARVEFEVHFPEGFNLELPQLKPVTKGSMDFDFAFDNRIDDPKKIRIVVKSEKGVEIPCSFEITKGGKHLTLRCEPVVNAKYKVEIFREGERISDTEIIADIAMRPKQPKPLKAKALDVQSVASVFGLQLKKGQKPEKGSICEVFEVSGIEDPSDVSLVVKDPTGQQLMCTFELEAKNKRLKMYVLPAVYGKHTVEVWTAGTKIKDHEFVTESHKIKAKALDAHSVASAFGVKFREGEKKEAPGSLELKKSGGKGEVVHADPGSVSSIKSKFGAKIALEKEEEERKRQAADKTKAAKGGGIFAQGSVGTGGAKFTFGASTEKKN